MKKLSFEKLDQLVFKAIEFDPRWENVAKYKKAEFKNMLLDENYTDDYLINMFTNGSYNSNDEYVGFKNGNIESMTKKEYYDDLVKNQNQILKDSFYLDN